MIIFYGKGKVGTSFHKLCTYLRKECVLMDDEDRDTALLEQAETLVPTPGVSQQHEIYTLYKDKIISELDIIQIFFTEQLLQPYTVGITGTDGKSTVTWLIGETLRQVFPTHHVYITGNRDEALSETLLKVLEAIKNEEIQREKIVFVIECSSFMLYPTKHFHFDVGVWTNLAPDHLNWHPTLQEYRNAKRRLVELSDHSIVSDDIAIKLERNLYKDVETYGIHYDLSSTHFVGSHNEKNFSVATKAVQKLCSVIAEKEHIAQPTEEVIQQALSTIKPLKHRMQLLKTIDGISRYDDGKSTSAQSLGAALASFQKPIIAICGGSDKGDSFDHLADSFFHTAEGIFLGQTAPQFATLFEKLGKPYHIALSMQEAVAQARRAAKQHHTEVILFSPGCASFDMFKNYADRAEQFIEQVEKI